MLVEGDEGTAVASCEEECGVMKAGLVGVILLELNHFLVRCTRPASASWEVGSVLRLALLCSSKGVVPEEQSKAGNESVAGVVRVESC